MTSGSSNAPCSDGEVFVPCVETGGVDSAIIEAEGRRRKIRQKATDHCLRNLRGLALDEAGKVVHHRLDRQEGGLRQDTLTVQRLLDSELR